MAILGNISNAVAMSVAGVAVTALVGSIGLNIIKDRKIDKLEAQITEQKIVNLTDALDIIRTYNDANSEPVTLDNVDCILRGLGNPTGKAEDCGPL